MSCMGKQISYNDIHFIGVHKIHSYRESIDINGVRACVRASERPMAYPHGKVSRDTVPIPGLYWDSMYTHWYIHMQVCMLQLTPIYG